MIYIEFVKRGNQANKYIEGCGLNAKDYFNDWNYIKLSVYYNRYQ